MKKVEKVLQEVHLYKTRKDMIAKVLYWIVSWLGGIAVLLDATETSALGSGYFLYSLALIMEFAFQIDDKTEIWSRILHTVFLFMISIVFLFSVGILLGVSVSASGYVTMKVLTYCIMGYMIIDLILFLIMDDGRNAREKEEKVMEEIPEQQAMFEERLYEGSLGRIEKE